MTPDDAPPSDSEFDGLLRRAADYYTEKIHQEGAGARGMDWRDTASQYLRFERLLKHLEVGAGISLLDVGCGSGELFAYCRERGWEPDYLGIDVSESMVAATRRRFGDKRALLASSADMVREGRGFDFVVASGTFNVRQDTPEEEWRRFVFHSVEEMYSLARRAVALNIMSSRVDYRYDHLFYTDPNYLADIADRCGTRDFVIDHGYPLFEMTLTLYKPAKDRS